MYMFLFRLTILICGLRLCVGLNSYIVFGNYPIGNFNHDVRGLYVTPFQSSLYWKDYVGSSRTTLTIIGEEEFIFNSDDQNEKLVYKDQNTNEWKFKDVNGEYVTGSADIIKITFEEYSPTWKHDANYHISDKELLISYSTLYCMALGGYLAVPTNHPFLPEDMDMGASLVWTGLQYVEGCWRYFVNHGDGRWFNATDNMLDMMNNQQDEGNCSVMYNDDGFHIKRVRCEGTTAKAVCRISEHFIHSRSLLRISEEKRKISEFSNECSLVQQSVPATMNSNDTLEFLAAIMNYYSYDGLLFLDGSDAEIYSSCRVVNSSGIVTYIYNCTEKNFRFACEISMDYENVWIGTMGNSWYGYYNETASHTESVARCHNNLRADPVKYVDSLELPWIMVEIHTGLSKYAGWSGKNFWISLSDGMTIENGSVISSSSSTSSTEECASVILYENELPRFERLPCGQDAYYICQKEYKEELTTLEKACPENYTRLFADTCVRIYSKAVHWVEAFSLCGLYTDGIGTLFQYSSADIDAGRKVAHEYLLTFLQSEQMDLWFGECTENTFAPFTLSTCAHLHVATSSENRVKFSGLTSSLGFVCQTPTFTIWNTPSFPSEELTVSPLSPVQHCRTGFYDLGQKCVSVEQIKQWYLYGRDYCHDLYNGDVVADVTEETHQRLKSILTAYSNFGLHKIWIRTNKSYATNFYHDEVAFEYGPTYWVDDSERNRSDEAGYMDWKGDWVATLSNETPYLSCEIGHCYRYGSDSYTGQLNTTINGFGCRPWADNSSTGHPNVERETSVTWPGNFCRDDGFYSVPWCYSYSDKIRYEMCDVSSCFASENILPSYVGMVESYSSFMNVKNMSITTMKCDENSTLLDCQCANEHCLGVTIDYVLIESSNGVQAAINCTVHSKNSEEPFVTRGKLTCVPREDGHIVQLPVKAIGKLPKVACPATMMLHACTHYDPQLPFSSVTLGKGTRGFYGSACTCERETCSGSECEISAICTSVNRNVVLYPTSYYMLHSSVQSFRLRVTQDMPWTQDSAAVYSFHEKMSQTICFWLRSAANAFIGPILYFSENNKYPVLALGGGYVNSNGIVIMPNGEELYFDINLIHDSAWHHVCMSLGMISEPTGHQCVLFIDGSPVVATSEACGFDSLPKAGQMFIGRGTDAVSPLHFDENQAIWIQEIPLNFEAKTIFSSPSDAEFGSFSFYEQALTGDEIRKILFSCLDAGRMSPSFLLSQKDIPDKEGIVVQLKGLVQFSSKTEPCYSSISRILTAVTSLSYTATFDSITLLVEVQGDDIPLLKHYDDLLYNLTVTCTLPYNPEHYQSRFIELSINESIQTVAKTFHLSNLKSASEYQCSIVNSLVFESGVELNVTREEVVIHARTRLPSVQNITGYSQFPTFETLEPGSDVISWLPPEAVEVHKYNVLLSFTDLENEFITEEIIVNGWEYTLTLDNATPGSLYYINITTVDIEELPGDVKSYQGNVQPQNPVFSNFAFVVLSKTINIKLQWIDEYSQHVDMYLIRYKEKSNDKWIELPVLNPTTLYTVFGLKGLTEYEFKISSTVGEKTSNESYLDVTTVEAGSFGISVRDVTTDSAIVEWPVDSQCEHYEIRLHATGHLNEEVDVTHCYFSPNVDESFIAVVTCTETIRIYQKALEHELTDLKSGCVYKVFVEQFGLQSSYTMTITLYIYSELSQPSMLELVNATDSMLKVSWQSPAPEEMVDLFQITASVADSPLTVVRQVFTSTPSTVIDSLLPATKYLINVTSSRGYALSKTAASLDAWTLRENNQPLFAWSKWTDFSECSHSCGLNGTKTRSRHCLNPEMETGVFCISETGITSDIDAERRNCGRLPCAVDGKWSQWTSYSPCHITCGGEGMQYRNRTCTEPAPSHGGKYCNGGEGWAVEWKKCGYSGCPVHGEWSNWMTMFTCNASCGGGYQQRKRYCSDPSPSTGGLNCEGEAKGLMACNTEQCPILGIWQTWSSWSTCNNLCGIMNSTRTRICMTSETGHNCTDAHLREETEFQQCIAVNPCDDEYHWGPWSLFSECAKTCETEAVRKRSRQCIWDSALYQTSRPCMKKEKQILPCGTRPCPVDGSWSFWELWSACSVSCGKGKQIRLRFCDDPKPQHGGVSCEGSETGLLKEFKPCDRGTCPLQRYVNSPSRLRHCDAERSTGGINWPWTFAGAKINNSCPTGTVGNAYRTCSQNEVWLEEDLTGCITETVVNIVKLVEEKEASSSAFQEISSELLRLLEKDENGESLSVAGDILKIHYLLTNLLDWKPSSFSDISRADKLKYVDTMTATMEKITNIKYQALWTTLNGTMTMKMIKNFLTLVEDASAYGQNVIEGDTSVTYKNNLNGDFNLLLKTVKASSHVTEVSYPSEGDPEYEFEKSTITVKLDSKFNDLNDDGVAKLMFVKYNTMSEFASGLNDKIASQTGRKFDGRMLNGVFIGATIRYNGTDTAGFTDKIKIEFIHKRKAKNPLCVFIDEREGNWLYNKDGCEVDIAYSNEEKTVCICHHLTTFAVLTHDFYDEKTLRLLQEQEFRSFYFNFSLAAFVVGIVIFSLMIIPMVSLKTQSSVPVHTLICHIVKHLAVLVLMSIGSSTASCAASSALLSYCVTAVCSVSWINCLDILLDIWDGKKRSQNSYATTVWLIPLMPACYVIVTYLIVSGQSDPTCQDMFAASILTPAICLSALMVSSGIAVFAYSLRVFSGFKMTPLKANRIEKRFWMAGFLLLFCFFNMVMTFVSFTGLTTPSYQVQITYIVIHSIELFYLALMHLWMNVEIRAYYYRKFGAKPAQEKVVVQPPKYVP